MTIELEGVQTPRVNAASAVLEAHESGLIEADPTFVDACRVGVLVAAEARRLGKEHRRLAQIDALNLGVDAVLVAARDGSDIGTAAQRTAEHTAEIERTLAKYTVANTAAKRAGAEVVRRLVPDHHGALLIEVYRGILRDASQAARVMADASTFDYGDPASLYGAGTPVQAAFRSLEPQAERLDVIRSTAAILADGSDWSPEALAGGGMERVRRWASDDRLAWEFRPRGHPVQRLVAAALEAQPRTDVKPRMPRSGRPRASDRARADAAAVQPGTP